MKLENFHVYQPHGNVVLDIFLFNTDDKESYNSCITYFFDANGKTGVSILTDVHAETPDECMTLTLRALGNMYSMVSAQCGVYNAASGDLIKSFNLNELYPDGFDGTIPPEDDPTALLATPPSKILFH